MFIQGDTMGSNRYLPRRHEGTKAQRNEGMIVFVA